MRATVFSKTGSSLGEGLGMAKRNTKKRAFGSLLRIAMPTDPKALAYYDFEMGLTEFGALGYATVQWAFFEEMLYVATARLYRRARKKIPLHAKNLDFSRRVASFNEAVRRMRKSPQKHLLSDLVPKIGNANGNRQKLTHGVWSYDARNPTRLYSKSRRGVPVTPHVEPFDIAKLAKFATSVGELSLSLDVLTDPKLPSGEGVAKPYMSRSFLLAVTGKDPASLGLPWPKRAEGSPPQGSSEEWDRKLKELADGDAPRKK